MYGNKMAFLSTVAHSPDSSDYAARVMNLRNAGFYLEAVLSTFSTNCRASNIAMNKRFNTRKRRVERRSS
jgi:hypothetical protein